MTQEENGNNNYYDQQQQRRSQSDESNTQRLSQSSSHKIQTDSSVYKESQNLSGRRNFYQGEEEAARESKISTRQVVDSQEGASHHLPAAPRGSLEAAVVAGAAGYNAQSYTEPQRLSFQIHGQQGPHSYRFGHDTGVGYNRQFRYEERDNKGVVHGRYGYYDQTGKLQIINYTADPYTGFHAEGEHVPRPEYRR